MNRKAFTMVELIAIITIIGVILIFALPNVTSTIERNKKDVMINDAKDFLDKVKYCLLVNKAVCQYPTTAGNPGAKKIYLDAVDPREEIKKSPFGNEYNRTNSYVKVSLNNSGGVKNYIYTIYLFDGEYKIDGKTMGDLNSDSKYTYVTK